MRGLEHKGEITTVDGTGAILDSDGQESIAIVKVCPSKRSGDQSLGLGEVLAIGLGLLAIGLSGGWLAIVLLAIDLSYTIM